MSCAREVHVFSSVVPRMGAGYVVPRGCAVDASLCSPFRRQGTPCASKRTLSCLFQKLAVLGCRRIID